MERLKGERFQYARNYRKKADDFNKRNADIIREVVDDAKEKPALERAVAELLLTQKLLRNQVHASDEKKLLRPRVRRVLSVDELRSSSSLGVGASNGLLTVFPSDERSSLMTCKFIVNGKLLELDVEAPLLRCVPKWKDKLEKMSPEPSREFDSFLSSKTSFAWLKKLAQEPPKGDLADPRALVRSVVHRDDILQAIEAL